MQPGAGVQRMSRKQQLLKRHRRNKRIALLIGVLVLVATGVLVAWWLPLILAVLLWAAHEAWFADHLFYSPKDSYEYAFPAGSEQPGLRLEAGRLLLDAPLAAEETLIVGIELKSTWLGRFFDPAVDLSGLASPDRQTFERGVAGRDDLRTVTRRTHRAWRQSGGAWCSRTTRCFRTWMSPATSSTA